ncbi:MULTISPECIES: FadR/GntR family transcriptional regulator [Asticcacaulis]|uniref:FadR/GntR family transcriptional regulator n=1 Tax=Asticcacaulis TaxID=76890 RepID=UPI001AE4EFAB|nr:MULTISPECIES: FadR/GntR family transcriptional regulator [Asticcacaulis]MBP2160787.1 DNA-binding FadR family transcriptional regulator [Asticcacaulis solisilvae]MDR6801832.1 DNA-binding FadR family transcriptional regulator [Asticcacaulis sp. BE141]
MDNKKKATRTEATAEFTFEEVPSQGRLHGSLARRLAIDILNGTYRPGDILPFQIDSSEALNISRTPYREALKILAAKGLIESKPKRGTLVCERARWNLLDPEVMGWMFETTPSNEFMDGLFELRLINEPAAAELAAERRSEEEVARLKHALDVMGRETLATEAGRLADLEFHKVLLLATRNEVLISLNSSIAAAIAWTTRLKSTDPADARNSWPDHARVFEAVANKNARDARWAMESLVRFAREDTTRSQMRRMS